MICRFIDTHAILIPPFSGDEEASLQRAAQGAANHRIPATGGKFCRVQALAENINRCMPHWVASGMLEKHSDVSSISYSRRWKRPAKVVAVGRSV